MAFDVEGARKAGYSDAEIVKYLAKDSGFDMAGAKRAGYSDGEVIAHLARGAALETKERGVVGKVKDIALGEKGLSLHDLNPMAPIQDAAKMLVGGPAVAAGAGLAGLVTEGANSLGLTDATGGDVVRKVQEAAAPYLAPRTVAGRLNEAVISKPFELLAEGADAVGGKVAEASGSPALGAGVNTAIQVVPQALLGRVGASPRVVSGAQRIAGLADSATTLPRRALEALRREEPAAPAAPTAAQPRASGSATPPQSSVAAQPTPGTQGSVGAAGTDMALQRQVRAEQLGFTGESAPTRGQLTRDPEQLKFEIENSKLQDIGKPLRDRAVAQTRQFHRKMEDFVGDSGAELADQGLKNRSIGKMIDRVIRERSTRDLNEINVAYAKARAAGELEAQVTLESVIAHLNEVEPQSPTAPLIKSARDTAIHQKIATIGPDGQLVALPTTLNTAELFRQTINASTDYSKPNIRQSTIIKGLVDEATQGLGGERYKHARNLYARHAQNYENSIAIKNLLGKRRGTDDRIVAFEDVFEHSILNGSLDDVQNLKRVLHRSGPEGAQAWRELRGATARWIYEQATKGSATDSAGRTVISPAGLDRAVRALDADGRLEKILTPKGAESMRALRDLSKELKTAPPEAAINHSNTVGTLLAAFGDVGVSSMAGLPVPVATLTRVIRQHIKDRALRQRIEEALHYVDNKHAASARHAVNAK